MTMAKFLSVAHSNTSRNVETCAILAGKLSADQFRITHVLVPKQKGKKRQTTTAFVLGLRNFFHYSPGTADSCTMSEDDLDLFDYQDKHDLITLGWVRSSFRSPKLLAVDFSVLLYVQ